MIAYVCSPVYILLANAHCACVDVCLCECLFVITVCFVCSPSHAHVQPGCMSLVCSSCMVCAQSCSVRCHTSLLATPQIVICHTVQTGILFLDVRLLFYPQFFAMSLNFFSPLSCMMSFYLSPFVSQVFHLVYGACHLVTANL